MLNEFYEYLILNKQISVPGIGTFFLETRPSETDISHRQIKPAGYTISWHQDHDTPPKKFFYWLADKGNVHYHEAIVRFNGFVYDLKDRIMSGNKVVWKHVGTLSKNVSGDIRFESAVNDHAIDPPVSATRIIRDKAVHKVRVGEDVKTSAEMSEWLNPAESRKNYWWAPALIVGIVLILVIAIYYSQKGMSASSSGNQQPLKPLPPTEHYTEIK